MTEEEAAQILRDKTPEGWSVHVAKYIQRYRKGESNTTFSASIVQLMEPGDDSEPVVVHGRDDSPFKAIASVMDQANAEGIL